VELFLKLVPILGCRFELARDALEFYSQTVYLRIAPAGRTSPASEASIARLHCSMCRLYFSMASVPPDGK